MKQKYKPLGQFFFENNDNEESLDDFLEDTAPLIGYIVHSFSALEEQLNSSICEFISDRGDEPGAIVIYKMSYSAKIDLFNRFGISMENAFKQKMSSFRSLIINLKKCGELRNAIVHAEWENMTDDGYTFVKMKFDNDGMKQKYMQFTPKSLESIDEFIHNTYMLFEKYIDEKYNLLRS